MMFVGIIEGQEAVDTVTQFSRMVSLEHELDVTLETEDGGVEQVKGCFLFPRSELPSHRCPPGLSTNVFVRFNRQLAHRRLNLGYAREDTVFGWEGVTRVYQSQQEEKSFRPQQFREYLARMERRRLLAALRSILASRRANAA